MHNYQSPNDERKIEFDISKEEVDRFTAIAAEARKFNENARKNLQEAIEKMWPVTNSSEEQLKRLDLNKG